MYERAINTETRRVLESISRSGLVGDFYLAGGTALAAQLGHRESIDLDWFSRTKFSNALLKQNLSSLGKFEVIGEEENTIHGVLDGVKVSFLRYDYDLLFPYITLFDVNFADLRDIAAMKIDAISSRGSKKDFVDLYFLLETHSLSELIGFFEKKYHAISFNMLHILKSLSYFEDAETDPMPVMLKEGNWDEMKQKIQKEVDVLLSL